MSIKIDYALDRKLSDTQVVLDIKKFTAELAPLVSSLPPKSLMFEDVEREVSSIERKFQGEVDQLVITFKE